MKETSDVDERAEPPGGEQTPPETTTDSGTAAHGRTAVLGSAIVLAVAGGVVFGALSGGEESADAAASPAPTAVPEEGEVIPVAPPRGAPVEGADLPPSSEVVPVGEATEVGDFRVTVESTDPDALARVEAGEGTYHDELGAGEVLVMATVSVENIGDRPLDPAVDLLAGYLGADGRDYDPLRGPFCMAEDSLYDVGNLAPGARVTGTVCQGMPADVVDGGVWVLRPAEDYGQVTYLSAG